MKTCTKCKKTKETTEFHRHPSTRDLLHCWCKDCVRVANSENVKKTKPKQRRKRSKTYAKVIRQKAVHVHRARKENPDAPIDEDIDIRKLYYRDNGTCRLCFKHVTPGQASIDHIIPLSEGGTHTWDNVQLTHRLCNLQKSNK